MLEELIANLIVQVVRIGDGIVGLLGLTQAGAQTLRENSLVGESPLETESRRWWDRLDSRWFWLSLLLLACAAVPGWSTGF